MVEGNPDSQWFSNWCGSGVRAGRQQLAERGDLVLMPFDRLSFPGDFRLYFPKDEEYTIVCISLESFQ